MHHFLLVTMGFVAFSCRMIAGEDSGVQVLRVLILHESAEMLLSPREKSNLESMLNLAFRRSDIDSVDGMKQLLSNEPICVIEYQGFIDKTKMVAYVYPMDYLFLGKQRLKYKPFPYGYVLFDQFQRKTVEEKAYRFIADIDK